MKNVNDNELDNISYEKYPSAILRQLIEIYECSPLEEYAWDEKTENEILSIPTAEYIEDHTETLKDAYNYGLNIGHCGAVSRYLSIHYKNALMHVGTAKLLEKTKNSPNGGHCWIEINGYVIDPTLMIKLPVELKEQYGYKTNKVLAKTGSTILSEYDTFDHEYNHMISDPEYTEKILTKK